MPKIHPTALVNPKAELAETVSVGPFSVIEENVTIGDGSQIDSHVLVASGTRIGKNCRIHHGAAVGTIPQDLKFSGEETILEIGDNVVIREFCDLNRGTVHQGITHVGNHCFFMAYTHIAHDCWIGDRVMTANAAQLGGHVKIEDWAIVGGLVPVHQFCIVGQHAFVGGGFRVVQDVPPYILGAGEPLTYKGLNIVGLKRRGFSEQTILALRKCYRIIYRLGLNTSQAVERIKQEVELLPEIQVVLNFIEKSSRGFIR